MGCRTSCLEIVRVVENVLEGFDGSGSASVIERVVGRVVGRVVV